MGIRDKPIAPGSPWQNASAERLTGSLLRECVDHMVVVFAENLVRLEYLGIADRKGLALANSQRPPGSYAERPWDELPECSGSIHHLRD
jgi:transposase InsO family protein